MHLFTSKTLSNYKKPQIRGSTRRGGRRREVRGRGMDKSFLQGKIHYWMSSQPLILRINVHIFFSFLKMFISVDVRG